MTTVRLTELTPEQVTLYENMWCFVHHRTLLEYQCIRFGVAWSSTAERDINPENQPLLAS